MCNYSNSKISILNCFFGNNTASFDGGGMYNSPQSNAQISDCTFEKNTAYYGGGGGISNDDGGGCIVTNCIFVENTAYNDSGFEDLTGGGFEDDSGAASTVTSCIFIENTAGDGGGIYCGEETGTIIQNCTIKENSTTSDGGGIYCDTNSHPEIENCIIVGNSADDGGGIDCWESTPLIRNCVIVGNTAISEGGGIEYDECYNVTISNCTILYNTAYTGGGIRYDDSTGKIENCIVWTNTADEGPTVSLIEGIDGSPSIVTVAYSDFWNGIGSIYVDSNSILNWGSGNIDSDPIFMDPDGDDDIAGTEDDDLHLLIDSPCINAGDPNADYSGQTDIDGQSRVIYGDADMGADEFAIIGDFDYSARVDFEDYAELVSAWLTGEGDELYNSIYDIDESPDGIIGYGDLLVFCNHWLETWPPVY
jgi:parallel beta-helix repeat protein/predicted outer membrane repeat protein